MTRRELEKWRDNPDHLSASLNHQEAARQGIRSGLDSLDNIIRKKGVKFSDWKESDYDEAMAEINFCTRMLGVNPGRPIPFTKPKRSAWEISLRNWGHDPRKDKSPGQEKIEDWIDEHGE